MSDNRIDDPTHLDPRAAPDAPTPADETSGAVGNEGDKLRSIAARLRGAADDLGGELMVDLPSRLGDHEGLLIGLANELEQLIK